MRRSVRYKGRRDLKLHVGCGSNPKRGWINIDLNESADLTLDLREPLPFADGSAVVIHGEHFLEHLELTGQRGTFWTAIETEEEPSEALTFLRECRRVLKPNGVLSLSVPNGRTTVQAYLRRDTLWMERGHALWHGTWCDTAMHHLNFSFRQGGEHRYTYDWETLRQVLRRAGFVRCRRRPFDQRLDSPRRRIGTLYVEARTPR